MRLDNSPLCAPVILSLLVDVCAPCCHCRALSLPAALSINVSQAAFRSMLDLTTPFCIVMAVNAANYLLNELLMVILPYGMAGCGWASVISQVGCISGRCSRCSWHLLGTCLLYV